MHNLAQSQLNVVGGIDTHKDVHAVVALDGLGRRLDGKLFPATSGGFTEIQRYLESFGPVDKIGIEGTGSWGAGVSRFLQCHELDVVEVNRPNRQRRRLKGKSDLADAEAAARAVLAGDATATPKAANGPIESIRLLRTTRSSAMRARTQAANQLRSLVDTAGEELREALIGLTMTKLCATAARMRPNSNLSDPTTATKCSLKSLAQRWLSLNEEIDCLDRQLEQLVTAVAPPELLNEFGTGIDTVGALLVSFGDNPQRVSTEAGFASLTGCCPVDASSGRQQRHRLNRGGDRSANSALWRIIIVRLKYDADTKAYVERRIAEGKTKREAIRCLKRYLARRIWKIMHNTTSVLSD